MIELPSTTYVGRRLPKEDFYRHLDLNAKQRDAFVKRIESLTIENSIKSSTMHVSDGEKVYEIFVMTLSLKESCTPITVMEAIAKANPHKIVFQCIYNDEVMYGVYRAAKMWSTDWLPGDISLVLKADNLDAIWDSYCSQIIFGADDIEDVDEEIKRSQRMRALDEEIAKLERAHGKEKQLGKRNALFQKLQGARQEKDALLKG